MAHRLEGLVGVAHLGADAGRPPVSVLEGKPVVPPFAGALWQRQERLVREVTDIDPLAAGEQVPPGSRVWRITATGYGCDVRLRLRPGQTGCPSLRFRVD